MRICICASLSKALHIIFGSGTHWTTSGADFLFLKDDAGSVNCPYLDLQDRISIEEWKPTADLFAGNWKTINLSFDEGFGRRVSMMISDDTKSGREDEFKE